MRRDTAASVTSAFLLSAAIAIWPDLFLFSKVMHLPIWAENLPGSFYTPLYLTFICLLPAAIAPSTLRASARAIAITISAASLPVLVLSFSSAGSVLEHLVQTLFHYVWMVGFNCAAPAAILLVSRYIVHDLSRTSDA